MKTDKATIFDLFHIHTRYVVPLFQRGYVWNRVSQWDPLWNDLVSVAADVARNRVTPTKRLRNHFLGAIVLNPTHVGLRRVPVREIIDGQQRLTTLQILLAVLRGATATVDNPYMQANINRVTVNPEPLTDPDERFKVWPTSALQEHIRNVLDTRSPDDLEKHYRRFHTFKYRKWTPPRPQVVEAYLFFAQRVREYLDDDPTELPIELLELSADERAEVLFEALLHNVELVTIELEPEDDAQTIFETLNARGEPLTPSDLVRNFVFLTATRQGENVAALYSSQWRAFEEEPSWRPYWKETERQGRLTRPRLDLFLFHYVTFRTGDELKIPHLYQAFREWWESPPAPRVIVDELRELNRYSVPYRELLTPTSRTRFGRFAARLRALDTTTAHPLILWAAGKFGTESPEFEEAIEDIESYLVRRAVCGYNQKNYNRFFLDTLNKLRGPDVSPTPAGLHAVLAVAQGESSLWPSDDAFRRAIVHEPLYRRSPSRITPMILQAIEDIEQSARGEDVEIHSSLTVEHVLPQAPAELNWPLELRDAEEEWEARTRRQSVTVHTLGNLTLLTQALNSEVSNGPYDVKRPLIALQSKLALNTYFQIENAPFWNEAAIENRGRKLAEDAIKIWPGP